MAGVEDYLPGPMRSFFYGNAPAGSPLSYEALQTRRKIAEQLMGRRSPFPKTIGEGLTYLGEAIGDRMQLADVDRLERAQQAGEDAIRRGAPPNLFTGGTPPATASSTAATPSSTTAGGAPTAAAPITPEPGTGREPFVFDATDVSPMDAGLPPYGPGRSTPPSTYRQAAVRPDPARADAVTESPLIGELTGGAMKDVPADLMSPDLLGGEVSRGNAGLQPIINAREFERRDVVNPATGASVVAGQISPSSFMPRAYGALPTEEPRAAIAQALTDRGDRQLSPEQMTEVAAGSRGQPSPQLTPEQMTNIARESNQAGGAATPASPTVTAQAPGNMFSPVPQAQGAPIVVPGVKPAPPPRSPSEEEIPAYKPQEFKDPGPEPKRLGLPQPTEGMRWAAPIMNNPRYSPGLRQQAKQLYDDEKEKLKTVQEQQEHDYRNKHTQWQQDVREFEKGKREENVRHLTFLKDSLEVQAKQATNPTLAAKARADLAKVESELEKARYEITQRAAAEEKERLERELKRKQLANVTSDQAKLFQHWQTGVLRDQQLRHTASDAVLAELAENLKGKVPVFGNAMVSPKYRAVKNMQDAWLLANARNESGAVIGQHEVHLYQPIFFPVYGDTPEDWARKETARTYRMQANYRALGDATPLADDFLRERRERRASPAEVKAIQEGKIGRVKDGNKVYRDGYWEDLDPYAR